MKFLKPLLATLFLCTPALAKYSVYDTQAQQMVDKTQWLKSLPPEGYFILGETHYTPNVQSTHADIIEDIVLHKTVKQNFSIGMEFLNHPIQDELNQVMANYKDDLIADQELLKPAIFNSIGKPESRNAYLPLFQKAKKLDGDILALNAPREWRQIIVKQDLKALTPEQTVPNMWVGGPEYYALFIEALGGHGGGAIDKYFEAQCYVDSVISYKAHHGINDYKFIVIGNFHTKYGFGTVERLTQLTDDPIVTTEVVNVEGLTPIEIEELKKEHPEYGAVADFIIFADK